MPLPSAWLPDAPLRKNEPAVFRLFFLFFLTIEFLHAIVESVINHVELNGLVSVFIAPVILDHLINQINVSSDLAGLWMLFS